MGAQEQRTNHVLSRGREIEPTWLLHKILSENCLQRACSLGPKDLLLSPLEIKIGFSFHHFSIINLKLCGLITC